MYVCTYPLSPSSYLTSSRFPFSFPIRHISSPSSLFLLFSLFHCLSTLFVPYLPLLSSPFALIFTLLVPLLSFYFPPLTLFSLSPYPLFPPFPLFPPIPSFPPFPSFPLFPFPPFYPFFSIRPPYVLPLSPYLHTALSPSFPLLSHTSLSSSSFFPFALSSLFLPYLSILFTFFHPSLHL